VAVTGRQAHAPGVDVPVVIGPLLDAEVLPPLDGAVPASVYVKVVRASDDFFDKAQMLLKKSPLLDGYVLPELAASTKRQGRVLTAVLPDSQLQQHTLLDTIQYEYRISRGALQGRKSKKIRQKRQWPDRFSSLACCRLRRAWWPCQRALRLSVPAL